MNFRHYDDYVRRNLKRGYTGKQMNVSYMKEKQLQVEDKVNDFKKKFKSSVEMANKWAEQHHIKEFMKKFGGEVVCTPIIVTTALLFCCVM